jgi:membrane associated rhomboid family serine protease
MQDEQKRMLRSLIVPGIFVLFMWLIKIFEVIFTIDLEGFGIAPLQWKGLTGILFSPLLHANFSHLSANTLPFLFLGGLLFYFYHPIAWKIFWLVWLVTGLWVWVFARGDAVHIGASGVVYGLASFLFLSGILRRDNRLMAITLLIAFLYGGLVWGIFPQLFPHQPISWESHLMGLLAGAVLAIYYRNSEPRRKVYEWETDEEEEEYEDYEDDDDPENNNPAPDDTGQGGGTTYNYEYKEKK